MHPPSQSPFQLAEAEQHSGKGNMPRSVILLLQVQQAIPALMDSHLKRAWVVDCCFIELV